MKKGGLIKTLFATLFAGLIFVGFAFNFVLYHSTDGSADIGLSFSDWNKQIDNGLALSKVGADTSNYALWQVARIIMILVLVLFVIALVTAFVKVWIDHKAVSTILRVSSVIILVLSILYIIAVIGGGFTLGTFGVIDMFYIPYVAPIWMAVFSIISSSILISFGDKKKSKKPNKKVENSLEKSKTSENN